MADSRGKFAPQTRRAGERVCKSRRGWHLEVRGKYININQRLKGEDIGFAKPIRPFKKLRVSEAAGQDVSGTCPLVILLS